MKKISRAGWRSQALCIALLALAGTVAAAPSPPAAAAAAGSEAVDPAAMDALDRMGAYLQTLTAFQVKATTQREEVLDNGMKVQYTAVADLLARKPDGLRVDVSGDRQQRQFFFDGKDFTLWAPRVRYYASVPAPPTIGELADRLAEKFEIELPLVDLFRWGATEEGRRAVTAAVDLGPGSVEGTTCGHYAFRQDGLDWQIWIQKGDYPLPRKLVLTTTTDEARPQFQATYTWNLAPSFNETAFTFDPPADAHRIVLNERPADAGSSD